MKKILPIHNQNNVTTYLNFSMPLCAIAGYENYNEWIYEHFTNLYLTKADDGEIWIDYLESTDYVKDIARCWWFETTDFGLDTDFIAIVKENIDKEYYMQIFIDQFYYSEWTAYHVEHGSMQLLIYGYDDDKELLYGVGFNKKVNFGLVTIGYEDLQNGAAACLERCEEMPVWVKMFFINFMDLLNKDIPYKADMDLMVRHIREFSQSEKLTDRLRNEIVIERGDRAWFGLNAQHEVLDALTQLADGHFVTDYRHVHLIVEHKKMMAKKIEALLSQPSLLKYKDVYMNEYMNIVNGFELQRMRYLKQAARDTGDMYGQLKSKKDIIKIRDNMEKVTFMEDEFYKRFLANI